MDIYLLWTNTKVNNSVYIVLTFVIAGSCKNSIECQNILFKSWRYVIHCLTMKLICKLAHKRESLCPRFLAKIADLTKYGLKIYDASTRRRGLQNKSNLHEKQRKWIICNPKSILNTVLNTVLVQHFHVFRTTRICWEMWKLLLNVDFSSDITIVIAGL